MRLIWITAGFLALALGVAGAVLPLMPTVPFLLLAAFCFARGSERLHAWLTGHPRFGPAIRDWQAHGAIRPAAKRLAMLSILATFGLSLIAGASATVLAIQAVVLGCVTVFILTRPDGPKVSRPVAE
ncbi:MAG: YbaN family protein [Pseudomonadota bacterium]